MKSLLALVCIQLVFVTSTLDTAEAATCDELSSLRLANTTITAARIVAAGEFTPPGAGAGDRDEGFRRLPAFCRVEGTIKPSSDSHIEFEVWLPSSGWNGDYLGVGNGGFTGSINYAARNAANVSATMATALAAGYATASTDTGHKSSSTDSSWALGHPEKMIDYGYRAIHETAVGAKRIVEAFYGQRPKKSYFNSCSNGGRQGLMEAQRYPEDYDGILVGAPAWDGTHGTVANVWNAQALMGRPDSFIPPRKLPAIEAAALQVCDAKDGVADGVIEHPTACPFDPSMLQCKGPESDSCLTLSQVAALKKIYAGPTTSKGEQIFPGLFPGAETGGWAVFVTGSAPGAGDGYRSAVGFFTDMVYRTPTWDFRTFNFDRDVAIIDATIGHFRNASDPDLRRFKARGGKLVMYHGWNDPAIAPQSTINYYRAVVSRMGQKSTEDFVRLYMVPGMNHCGGGPGTISFGASPASTQDPQRSLAAALERWVNDGVAPGTIIASKYRSAHDPASGLVRTRPLCRYPQVANYKGAGRPDDAASFVCASP